MDKPYIGVVLLLLVVVGCTFEGKYNGEKRILECKDFRDNEVFQFNTENIFSIKVRPSGRASFRVIDTEGRERYLTSTMESYMKCKELK